MSRFIRAPAGKYNSAVAKIAIKGRPIRHYINIKISNINTK